MSSEPTAEDLYDFSKILTDEQLKDDPEYDGGTLILGVTHKRNIIESDYEGDFTKKQRDDWLKSQEDKPLTDSDIDKALKEFEESKRRNNGNI